ncbi:peptide chain release factor N(5)-glutamine methyltransferase [Actinomyces sp. 565]|uniref:peptide chain release factor N(5)-glutamine methyltransferase n=1 Tax=Actinomyces sp. 565 TaxID=2057794 RepID=UPI0013A6A917|nr:peptide chain release factor N(5)-glutamine methyltransferase [Actinomyces sp. 565]
MSALDRYALRRTVREAGLALVRAGVASPEVDARLLAEHLLGGPVLLADGAPEDFAAAYAQLVERRAAREPLQHILGVMWFRGLELACRPGVFIVRPETEVVAGAAIDAARAIAPGEEAGVVDLCTGSGAIAAAVAREVLTARVWAVEAAPDAVALARENCERLAPGRVKVIHGDAIDPAVLDELDGRVDVVVSNPPYVPAGAVEDTETAEYDPHVALYGGGEDGLETPVAVVARAAALLRPGGVLIMEHDPGQSAPLRAAARETGFAVATTGVDLTGRERFLRAVR